MLVKYFLCVVISLFKTKTASYMQLPLSSQFFSFSMLSSGVFFCFSLCKRKFTIGDMRKISPGYVQVKVMAIRIGCIKNIHGVAVTLEGF